MDDNRNLDVNPALAEAYFFRLPRAYTYADYIWPGLLMSQERLESIQDFEFRPNDILIASYPKSGTTWVSEVVSLICQKGDVDLVRRQPLHDRVPWLELDNNYVWIKVFWIWQVFTKLLGFGGKEDDEKDKRDETEDSPRVWFTHLPLELLPKRALESGCRIIYVSRNPKDNAVSFFHFHQMARFLGLQKTTWNEFFPLYTVGKIYCGSWFEHVLGYWKFNKVNPRMLFLKYEDMKKDLGKEVGRICEFVDMDLSAETQTKIVHHSSFNTMKDNKMANRDGVWLFNQSISKFMRKGVVGDWKNYFTVAQNELFDEIYKQKMKEVDLKFEFEPAV